MDDSIVRVGESVGVLARAISEAIFSMRGISQGLWVGLDYEIERWNLEGMREEAMIIADRASDGRSRANFQLIPRKLTVQFVTPEGFYIDIRKGSVVVDFTKDFESAEKFRRAVKCFESSPADTRAVG